MNDFLKALGADLRDRRLLPFVALVSVALVAGVAYAALAGGASTAPTAPGPVAGGVTPGIAATQAKPETALAETTNGTAEQRKGKVHDPFKLLPGAEKATSSSTSTSTSTTTSTSSGTSTGTSTGSTGASAPKTESGAGKGSGSGEAESKPTKPATPSKPKTVYHVAVLFGLVPSGAAPLITTTLTPFQSLKLFTPLPSAKQPLLVFRGVTAGGKAATFTLVGEAILHGQAACLPNATQCQAIDLQKERYEQLEYLTATGEVLTYELRVVSISSTKASTASLHSFLRSQSKAGRDLLRNAHLLDIPLLRSSSQPGVFVFAARAAHAARAHTAAGRGR
ncbi:MAG TPA: hypothetical protein VGN13_12845 [Solirubrobacteraceae bacterium]|jgi:hypothetical protein